MPPHVTVDACDCACDVYDPPGGCSCNPPIPGQPGVSYSGNQYYCTDFGGFIQYDRRKNCLVGLFSIVLDEDRGPRICDTETAPCAKHRWLLSRKKATTWLPLVSTVFLGRQAFLRVRAYAMIGSADTVVWWQQPGPPLRRHTSRWRRSACVAQFSY